MVFVGVGRALPLTSPAYDLGASEEEVRERWERHREAIRRGESGAKSLSAADDVTNADDNTSL